MASEASQRSQLMPLFEVRSVAINVSVWPPVFGVSRIDVIDTSSDDWYSACATIQDVEVAFEKFWNYPNAGDVLHNPL